MSLGKSLLALLSGALLTALLGTPSQAQATPSLPALAEKSGVSVKILQEALAEARYQQKIIDAMTRPAEGKPWWQYRKIFITTTRIDNGVQFYLKNEELLKRAAQTYGVPEEIICAIIGVETSYGSGMGTWAVLDALYTLGFKYPPREKYFSGEFANFVKLCRREGWTYREVKGSYAGAMGMGQFMPSSYLAYGVDFNADGKVDLFHSTADAVGSVANYFKQNGWKSGQAVYYPVHLGKANAKALMDKQWNLTARELYRAGATTKVNLSPEVKLRLFAFDLEDGSRGYAVGLNNFHSIMRYNTSQLYARAVFELSEFIRLGYVKAKQQQGVTVNPQGRSN
ncbi:MAG: lytic murein transglycosylase B [Succinivibrio sp.]|nr:lytic murein transglycosylase B [Succinivibrio sp.]